MIRGRRTKPPAWSGEEIAILIDVYAREGIDGASDALPERSWGAITMMAAKLGVRSPFACPGRKPALQDKDLEEAIRLREQGWSFERIGKRFGVAETSAQNAVLIALCPRKGFVPAERDMNGRLLPAGLDRLREMLREGATGVDISLQLGLSVARIAEERRRLNADLSARGLPLLPPPGNGKMYSGARIKNDVYAQVDALFMAGHGASRIAEMTGVSRVHCGRRRQKLVQSLRKEGRCLPGCDSEGRRIAYKDSLSAVSDVQKAIVRAELMKGTSVARAAKIAVIGSSYAYQLRNELKADLAKQGRSLPATVRPGSARAADVDSRLNWLPTGKRNLVLFRRILAEVGGDMLEAKRRTIQALTPTPKKPAEPRRPLTFEEQLARVAAGAQLVSTFQYRRADPSMTLGGIASAAI